MCGDADTPWNFELGTSNFFPDTAHVCCEHPLESPMSVSRRDFLKATAAASAVALVPQFAPAADDPYKGFRMGIQSYSLRGFKVQKALEITKKLGLRYWESYPAHVPVSAVPKYIEEQKALLGNS